MGVERGDGEAEDQISAIAEQKFLDFTCTFIFIYILPWFGKKDKEGLHSYS